MIVTEIIVVPSVLHAHMLMHMSTHHITNANVYMQACAQSKASQATETPGMRPIGMAAIDYSLASTSWKCV